MTPDVKAEIKNALWGCLEIPLYLKIGTTRFTGTLDAFKRSIWIPALLIPVVAIVIPNPEPYADKSHLWAICLLMLQMFLSTSCFIAGIYFFRMKHVTNEQFLRCITCYNWLSLPSFIINIPLMMLAVTGVNTWDDVYAMMILLVLYSYTYVAFMITYTLRINGYLGCAFALMALLIDDIVRNICTYFMLHF